MRPSKCHALTSVSCYSGASISLTPRAPLDQGFAVTNNDIIRRIRYIFDFNDAKMISLFALADYQVSREQISNWLKNDDDPLQEKLSDKELAIFLNGFINDRRGKRDGEQPEPESVLTKNIIFRKLRIALNMKDVDILQILTLTNFHISKHELSAFFRSPNHKHYRVCKNQVLRNFLKGLQIKYRTSTTPSANESIWKH